tara:strand:+ start:356 stop:547 length:192 start_codon:yes stop_codon:yes gene_type:complete
MDYGSNGLWVILFVFLTIVVPFLLNPETYEPIEAYQFDVKDALEHENRATIHSESLVWMNQGK